MHLVPRNTSHSFHLDTLGHPRREFDAHRACDAAHERTMHAYVNEPLGKRLGCLGRRVMTRRLAQQQERAK